MCIKQTLVERVHADRDRGWETGNRLSWTKDIVPLVDAYDALVAEVEQLRAQRGLDNEEAARLYDFARDKGTALERAAVVAWLRANTCGCHDFASYIERGEHRSEEEP